MRFKLNTNFPIKQMKKLFILIECQQIYGYFNSNSSYKWPDMSDSSDSCGPHHRTLQ